MPRTDVYDRILQELAAGEMDKLEVKIFESLRRVYPATLTRYDLLECVFGYRPEEHENLNNNTDDRKIRSAIASMFEKGVPIVSTSGGAGYRIDIELENWAGLISELEGRKATISTKLDAANRIVSRIRKSGINAIQTDVPASPRQLSFLGGGR